MIHKLALKRLYQPIEKLMEQLGKILAWMTFMLVIVEFLVVVLRYLFEIPSIRLQESALWIHSIIFMLGAAYTLGRDEHVRVDIYYRKKSQRFQAWVNLMGVLLLLFPVCYYLFIYSVDSVVLSWKLSETSQEVGGLPALYLIKTLLLILPTLLFLQGIATLLKQIEILSEHSITKLPKHEPSL